MIPHPVFPGAVRREDDARTLLLFGLIRPYKQVEHAIELSRRLGVRLVVAGDPLYDIGDLRSAPGVEWRLGYQSERADRRSPCRGHSHSVPLPARARSERGPPAGARIRSSRRRLRRRRHSRAGATLRRRLVVPADDIDALAEGVGRLLDDPDALASAREGALRARAELTWDVAAAAHLALYEELLG